MKFSDCRNQTRHTASAVLVAGFAVQRGEEFVYSFILFKSSASGSLLKLSSNFKISASVFL